MIIDVFQDTVCPWCRIGEANLKAAIAQWDGGPVTVRHHPFELQPGMPAEGRDYREHMASIKGDRNLQPMFDRVCQAGESCGVTFRFERIERAPNTLLSHVLVAAAPEAKQGELLDAIHRAHFEEGRDIGDRDVLLAIAEATGFDRAHAAAALDDERLRAEVAEQAAWARAQGITGVPFFVFDGALAVSGAQPPAILLQAMRQAAAVTANR